MKNLSSWLLVMFMGMFWLFRVVVAFQAQYDQSFGGFAAFNFTVEVALLFIAILCMILVLRRNIIGSYYRRNRRTAILGKRCEVFYD